jgi:hypothetical protein
MPDPVGSVGAPVDWSLSSVGEELSSAQSPQTAPPNVCLATDAGNVPTGAGVLTQQFQENHYAFIAAATAGNDSLPAPRELVAPASLPSSADDQVNLQIGVPRFQGRATLGGVHLHGGVDVLNANLHLGSQNDDGSRGENIGAGANAVGVEATAEYSGWSLTAGLSLSVGASVSSGEQRDLDGDGNAERCFKVSFGPLTLGECDEL